MYQAERTQTSEERKKSYEDMICLVLIVVVGYKFSADNTGEWYFIHGLSASFG